MFKCIGYPNTTVTYNEIYNYYNVVINIPIPELIELYSNEPKWKMTVNYLTMSMNRADIPIKIWLGVPLVYDYFYN
jgi:hypothetical protein